MSRKVSETWGTPSRSPLAFPVQALHHFGDVVVLEEADGGDSGGSCGEAGVSVGQSNTAQGEDWDVWFARSFQCNEPCGACFFLLEDGGEDGEGCVVGGGLSHFFWRVTGDCDQRVSW